MQCNTGTLGSLYATTQCAIHVAHLHMNCSV